VADERDDNWDYVPGQDPPLPPWCGECKAPIGTSHLDGCSGLGEVIERDRARGLG